MNINGLIFRCLSIILIFVFGFDFSLFAAGSEKKILFISGSHSHGPGEHEFISGSDLLQKCLRESGLPIKTTGIVSWSPEVESTSWDSVVLYSDGLENHVLRDHVPWLRRHLESGGGMVVLHFALEPTPKTALADLFDQFLGGKFEENWSVNPIWNLEKPILAKHPITQGVKAFSIQDEWYYHLRLNKNITPILSAIPPLSSLGAEGPRSGNAAVRQELEAGTAQTLAWVLDPPGKARAFGFVGGHFHRNWFEENFRKLVLNGIIWSSGINVPEGGVASQLPIELLYPTIDDAIIQGDLRGVQAFLQNNPKSLNQGKTPSLPPLIHAILRKKREIAAFLIQNGAEVNIYNSSHQTPLHLVVQRDLPDLIGALLKRNANPNELDQSGWTPLHYAAAQDRVQRAKELLDGGADVNAKSERGGTPLHEAAASGSEAMIKLLLERGVDPRVISKTGQSAISIARERNNLPAIHLLVPHS